MTRRDFLVSGLTALLMSGCTTIGPEPKSISTLVLVDETGLRDDSSVVQCHREAIEQILATLPPDRKATLCLDTVSNNSRLNSHPKAFTFAPKGWDDTNTTYSRKLDATRRQVWEHWGKLLKASETTTGPSHTTLLDSLDMVSKLRPDRLVMLTDGFEQSSRYDFTEGKDLNDSRIDAILKQDENRMPDLSGIDIWFVAAASHQTGIEPNRLRWVERFWCRYFDRAGARLPGNHYAPVLIHWSWTADNSSQAPGRSGSAPTTTTTYDRQALVSR